MPKLFARRPLPASLELELASELAAENRSTGKIEYRLSPFTVVSTGWKSVSDTDSTSGSAGSFSAGIHYRRPFPGVTLLPPEITRGVP